MLSASYLLPSLFLLSYARIKFCFFIRLFEIRAKCHKISKWTNVAVHVWQRCYKIRGSVASNSMECAVLQCKRVWVKCAKGDVRLEENTKMPKYKNQSITVLNKIYFSCLLSKITNVSSIGPLPGPLERALHAIPKFPIFNQKEEQLTLNP